MSTDKDSRPKFTFSLGSYHVFIEELPDKMGFQILVAHEDKEEPLDVKRYYYKDMGEPKQKDDG